jgi:hypothetical protein
MNHGIAPLRWLARSPLGTFSKVFVATVLGVVVADLSTIGMAAFDTGRRIEAWVIAGLVAGLPVLINWLNPQDPRYGVRARGSAAQRDATAATAATTATAAGASPSAQPVLS